MHSWTLVVSSDYANSLNFSLFLQIKFVYLCVASQIWDDNLIVWNDVQCICCASCTSTCACISILYVWHTFTIMFFLCLCVIIFRCGRLCCIWYRILLLLLHYSVITHVQADYSLSVNYLLHAHVYYYYYSSTHAPCVVEMSDCVCVIP